MGPLDGEARLTSAVKSPVSSRRSALVGALILLCPIVAQSARGGGVTVITHGFNGNVTDWIIPMAERAVDYPGYDGSDFSCYQLEITSGGGVFSSANSTPAVTNAFGGIWDFNVNATCPLGDDFFTGTVIRRCQHRIHDEWLGTGSNHDVISSEIKISGAVEVVGGGFAQLHNAG